MPVAVRAGGLARTVAIASLTLTAALLPSHAIGQRQKPSLVRNGPPTVTDPDTARSKRSTDDGKRSTDDGKRSTDDGKRSTDDGKRSTDDGKRSTDDGKPSTDDGKPSTDDGYRRRRSRGHRPAAWRSPAAGDSTSGGPEILFTFDDGPHEQHTAPILNALAKHRIQAIFYWVGNRVERGAGSEDRRAIVRRAVAEGHLIANHTVNHAHLCDVARDRAAAEIDRAGQLLAAASRLPVLLFRAPYGDHCKQLYRLLAERGLQHLHWDIDPREWEHHNSKRTADHVIRRLRRLRGRAVLLLHDTHLASARAVPQILDWLAAENRRRRRRGVPQIRVLSGSQLVAEKFDSPFATWAAKATGSALRGLTATTARLLP